MEVDILVYMHAGSEMTGLLDYTATQLCRLYYRAR